MAQKVIKLDDVKNGETKKSANKKRVRRVKILQYENNPKTGESLNFDETNIIEAINFLDYRLTRWAWVKHDKDVITEADIKDSLLEGETDGYTAEDLGKKKGTHYHVVLDLKNNMTISAIAKRFGVPEQFVSVIEGSTRTHDAVLDCIAYLTHEDEKQQAYGKHLYPREEINISDTNIWNDVDKQKAREELKKGGTPADVRLIIEEIGKGMTMDQVYKYDNVMYNQNYNVFKRARQEYIKRAPLPTTRTNYYITGQGGTGKTLSAVVLARSLRPDIERDEDLFFTVGDGAVPFDGYAGQPIIIWDDWRALDLLNTFDRSLTWKLFAINPSRVEVNVKYGSTVLINSVNIVTSVEPYISFMEHLAGEYEDKKGVKYNAEDSRQAYRRFPFFLEISQDSILLARNRGLSREEIAQVEPILRFENSMQQLIQHQEKGARKEVAEFLTAPLVAMDDEAKKYQGAMDEELKPLSTLKLLPLEE